MKLRTVVVIPALNEATHIREVVETILNDRATETFEVWVLDGGSADGTQDIVRELNQPNVRLVDNPERTQAHAVNKAAQMAAELPSVQYLVRVDAHAKYPANFVSDLIATMESEGSDSVVIPMKTVGGNDVQTAASLLYNSWLGNGGSPHRTGEYRGFVEHGHHAAFRLEAYRKVGGYDVRFAANEDAEFDKRFTDAGFKIFLENKVTIHYVPRETYSAFWKQMKRNGHFRVMTAMKHRVPLGKRQLMPLSIAPCLIVCTLLALLIHPVFAGGALTYLCLVLALAAQAVKLPRSGRVLDCLRVAALAVISHVGFSVGGLESLIRGYIVKPALREELRSGPRPAKAA